jgi:hypothetical protein
MAQTPCRYLRRTGTGRRTVETTPSPTLDCTRPGRTSTVVALLLCVYLAAPAIAAQQPTLAWLVPSRCRLFIELYDLPSFNAQLQQAGVWTALGAFEGPGQQTAATWQHRLEQMLDMNWPEITETLLGQQVALASTDPHTLSDSVVLARVPDVATVARLLGARKARVGPRVGAIQCYQIGSMRLGVLGRLVIFEPVKQPGAQLFDQTVLIAAGRLHDALGSTPEFIKQTRHLRRKHSGLVYLNLAGAGTSGSAPVHRPWPFSRVSILAAGWNTRDDGLDLRLSLPQSAPGPGRFVSTSLAAKLPAGTLATMGLTVDYPDLYRRLVAESSPTYLRAYLAVVRTVLGPEQFQNGLLANLDRQTLVVIGQQPAQNRSSPAGFRRASLTVLIRAKNRPTVEASLDQLGDGLLTLLNAHAMRLGMSPTLIVAKRPHRNVAIRWIDLSPLLAATTTSPLWRQFQVAWAPLDDDWIALSTHADHLRQIIDARGEASPKLGTTEVFGSLAERRCRHFVMVQPDQISATVQSWLDLLGAHQPHLLEPDYWARRSGPAPRRVSLGLAVKPDADRPGAAVVVRTLRGWPADGKLLPNDRIVAVNGRGVSHDQPVGELRQAIAQAAGQAGVVFSVQRDGRALDLTVPLPLATGSTTKLPRLNPIEALQRLTGLCRLFSAASYCATQDSGGRADSVLSLRFVQR